MAIYYDKSISCQRVHFLSTIPPLHPWWLSFLCMCKSNSKETPFHQPYLHSISWSSSCLFWNLVFCEFVHTLKVIYPKHSQDRPLWHHINCCPYRYLYLLLSWICLLQLFWQFSDDLIFFILLHREVGVYGMMSLILFLRHPKY